MSKKMIFFIRVLWVSFLTNLLILFDFIRGHIFRLQENSIPRKRYKKTPEDYQVDDSVTKSEEESESLLRFQFPTFDEFVKNNGGHSTSDQVMYDNSNGMGNLTSARIHVNSENMISKLEDIVQPKTCIEIESPLREVSVNFSSIDVSKKVEETEVENEEELNSMNNLHIFRNETHFLSEDEFSLSGCDSDLMVSSCESSLRSSFIDSLSDGFLSDIDFERAFEVDTLIKYGLKEWQLTSEFLTQDDTELRNLNKDYDNDDLENEDEDILQELNNLETHLEDDGETSDTEDATNVGNSESNVVDENDILDPETAERQNLEPDLEDFNDILGANDVSNDENTLKSEQNSENSSSNEQLSSDFEEPNGLESEWEHQDLVEQLKMEIKKVRAIGLPTILEESESPKIMDDLKPWKIEEKYQHEGTIELHKFYKSYRERMRKLDILNFQKMYAIGFLKLKDGLQPFTKNKISNPAIAAIVSVDCWPCKPKSTTEVHPPVMKKFARELESDLEMIYVGHMCLSWEFLCWQYGKVLELWESDPHGNRRYNDVAEKFQTFQVLLTRFLEDEPFQGPRVQHYVKNRCVLRNLLQVPVVRDDNHSRDRKKERKLVNSKDGITSLQLVEIIESSIRILWQFIRTDRDTSNVVLVNCRRSTDIELQNPADASLLAKVRSALDKKDKKLRELTRIENCLTRNCPRFRQEEDSDHVLYFFSRVDLKLVSRVLNMSRLSTDQLVWCKDKLNKIKFIRRRLYVESSVLFFPCS